VRRLQGLYICILAWFFELLRRAQTEYRYDQYRKNMISILRFVLMGRGLFSMGRGKSFWATDPILDGFP